MAILLDGKKTANDLNEITRNRILKLKQRGIVPGLAVVIVGEDQASQRYVRNKHKLALKLGVNSIIKAVPATVTENQLLNLIAELNHDQTIQAILVQDPLPTRLNEQKIMQSISPEKDVDGFTTTNVGKLYLNHSGNYPVACTPKGIMTLLQQYNISLRGKKAVVIGRSAIVGKPMAALLVNAGASVSILHRYTNDITEYTQDADIVISATGVLRLLDSEAIKSGAVIVDVGQNLDENGHLVGDVDFETVRQKAAAITPVPGGVGPMTIATLMQQTVDLTEWGATNDE
ncbi:bifunctional methylenetetrahydrofolate dehydrogenase/methenyltetrahydrofolate cyclohydrolase [Lentilactobacillus senioris]|uniref:bifunctional 5,10-methylenetetrahydrofolate dehydrogenase/5,10-methenyltetrahydrofolate cyclohydrolase n=1 Tax=Lentilactobacillus senioris TaxID=931534 RepID=UPI002280EFED|nr:tetrahydrofolate dehydrogenase/cyclohydrolase catalytic domain-containing protein [Lentilactobacillus senioris]MCY9806910.1 bifunctional methylenetetrahydrofolate dehydrogenase/methenyltetrahydrofolate cyclohydrolase [Lentilactobacillus senioris]